MFSIYLIILIYVFWATSAIVESMKWLNTYSFERFKYFDYHFFRFVNSLSVFLICTVVLTDIKNVSIYCLLGHWLLANQLYERIQDKMVRKKYFINKDTMFNTLSYSIRIKWWYTIITIFLGFFLLFI